MSPIPTHIIHALSRHWSGCLAAYRRHQHDEHREALIAEAMRFIGLRLESDLRPSTYWGSQPLIRCAAVLLFLVDRDIVTRTHRHGRVAFEATEGAERWIAAEPALVPYFEPTLELIASLRREQMRCFPKAD